MVDITAKLILYRLNESWASMAERWDRIVYTDDSKEMLDIINILFIGWIVLAAVVYVVGNLVSEHLIHKRNRLQEDARRSTTLPQSASETTAIENESDRPQRSRSPSPSDPETDTVRWVRRVEQWLHCQRNYTVFVQTWMLALNETAKKSVPEDAVLVEFDQIELLSSPPRLHEISELVESNQEVVATAKIESTQTNFITTVTQQKGLEMLSSDYIATLEKMNGKLEISHFTQEPRLKLRFCEGPDIKLSLTPRDGNMTSSSLNQSALINTIKSIINNSLSTTMVDVKFSHHSDFPMYRRSSPIGRNGLPLVDNMLQYASTDLSHKRLLVKAIKATNVGGNKDCHSAYCVVEMDTPPQRYETAAVEDTNSPYWNECFIFDLKDKAAEVLFEVYDKNVGEPDRFLGLAIMSVEELLTNQSQRQVINLHPRPLEPDNVSGTVTAEFLFMQRAEIPSSTIDSPTRPSWLSPSADNQELSPGKIIETKSHVTHSGAVITTTTIKKAPGEDTQNNGSLTEAALKELESRKGSPTSVPNKSTLIIHSVQRLENYDEESNNTSSSPYSRRDPSSPTESGSSYSEKDTYNQRSRSKERKSFIGTLKKKFSFRKLRSKSMEQQGDEIDASRDSSRSISTERSKSTPVSREASSGRSGSTYLGIPGMRGIEDDSTRSSISDTSGISASSTRTFVSEKSALIIETNENGVIKHYLLPGYLANRSKWRRRGVKLHIYNDHTFVARHLSGFIRCEACGKMLSRRPGKQGYACRDCNLICHKRCHVRVDAHCPNSTVNTMDIEYVQDPKMKPKMR